MPATTFEDAGQAMKRLRHRFGQRMERDLRAVSSCADRCDTGPLPASEIAVLRQICHSLIGSAGLFGFDNVAAAAAHVHAAVTDGQSDGQKLGLATRELAAQILEALAPQDFIDGDLGAKTERS
jgi:HPt (histidine-containing phosphotransfer) domain-containing protein